MFYRDQGGSHNWWLKFGNTWLGYYPNGWFNSAGLANKGDEINYGGEIVNDNNAGVHTTTQMGSGRFPSEGWQYSAFVKRIQYVDMNNISQDASSLSRSVSGASYYDLALYSISDTNWLNYFYFGGPGLVVPLSITSQPQSQTVTVGSTVTFSVAASGSQPLSYQWELNGVNISGPTSASYTISNVQANQAGNYTVVVSNASGTVTSATAVLTVNVPPSITEQPQSRTVNAGNTVTFSVTASGTAPLSYQWYQSNSLIAGATAASYTITGVQPTDAGDYMVTVSNVAGELDSTNAILTVQYGPVIIAQPQSQNAKIGETATFSVVATAIPAPTYQWQFNSVNIPSAGSSSYTLISFQPSNVGDYTVVVRNSLGSVNSSNAVLAVAVCVPAPPGLVSWWQAEGNANDTVGGNSGILVNGVTFAPGKVGQAFSFDGTNSYIEIADNPNLHFTNAITIEAWIYPTSLGACHNIVSKWDWAVANAQMSYTTAVQPSGQMGFGVCNVGDCPQGAGSVLSTNSIPVNQWTHFAATYDGSNLSIYVNGVCENQTAYNNGIFPGTNSLLIGAAVTNGAEVVSPFVGLIDEAAVYNQALSAAEIAAIYNASSAGKCSLPPTVLTQPANQTVIAGTTANFTVAAGGTPPLSFQWYQKNSVVAGATNASYTISATQPSNAGSYDVIVWNNSGSVTSTVATLTVGTWADVYYDFETAATSPVWLGATQMIQNTSASHQGTNAIAFTGAYPNAYLLTQLPEGTRNVQFYFYDDYGPNPPLYQYTVLLAPGSHELDGIRWLFDVGWRLGDYSANDNEPLLCLGPGGVTARVPWGRFRTVGWHKFTFAVGPSSVAMSVDDTPVFQTNMMRIARYLKLQCGQGGGWGRMDDLVLTYVTVPQPTLTISQAGNGIRVAWPASATGFVLQETSSPQGNWANSSAAVVVQGNENVAVIATTGTLKFYRLQK